MDEKSVVGNNDFTTRLFREQVERDVREAYAEAGKIIDLPKTLYVEEEYLDRMASMTCEDQAIRIVYEFVRSHLDPSDEDYYTFYISAVYVVQFTYILGNWRAMVSTSLPDGMYYEVVYEKRRGTARLDAYKRSDHQEFMVSEVPGPHLESWAVTAVSDYAVSAQSYPVNRATLNIRISSSVYIIGCWKALIDTSLDDGMLYEVTFDPRKRVAYLDPYKLFDSRQLAIPSRPAASSG